VGRVVEEAKRGMQGAFRLVGLSNNQWLRSLVPKDEGPLVGVKLGRRLAGSVGAFGIL
jgi:hypothetical protein